MTFIALLFLSFGLYQVITDRIRVPSLAAVRATSRMGKGKRSSKEAFAYPVARKIEKFIRLSKFRHDSIQSDIDTAGLSMTPEFFVATCIVNAGFIVLCAVIMLPVHPLIAVGFMVFAAFVLFNDMHSLSKAKEKRRAAIENEMQQFASAVNRSLSRRQDIYNVIKSYRSVAGKELGEELDLLLTDMRTGNREEALMHFESRIDSPIVSEFCRCLVGINRGDNMSVYLTSVEMKAKDKKIENLDKEADKRPEKLTLASVVLLVAMISMCIAVMIVQFTQGMGVFHF